MTVIVQLTGRSQDSGTGNIDLCPFGRGGVYRGGGPASCVGGRRREEDQIRNSADSLLCAGELDCSR